MKWLRLLICLIAVNTSKGAILFDGVDDVVNLPATAAHNITGPITIAAWVKTTVGSFQNVFRGYQDGSPFGGYALGIGNPTAGRIGYYNGTTTTWVAGGSTVTNGQWRFIAVSVTGTTASFYLDGVADGTAVSAVPNSYSGVRSIGAESDFGGRFNGTIGEVILIDRALTATEIELIYKSRVTTIPMTWKPVGLWPLNNVPGGSSCDNLILLDLTGNGNGVGDNGTNNTGLTAVSEILLSNP